MSEQTTSIDTAEEMDIIESEKPKTKQEIYRDIQ
jgi:hypothetical protein